MTTLTVSEDDAGQRLDKFLSRALPDISRARFQALIEEGAVVKFPSRLREGSGEGSRSSTLQPADVLPHPTPPPHAGEGKLTAAYKVKQGDAFTVTIPEVKPLDLTPANITLDIVYEDDDILVLNKPAGMTVHPAAGTENDTLVHALLAHCGDSLSGIGGVARPGIVHRIDKDTSGLLAIAKHDAAHQHLSAQLKSREMKRTYIAFTWGALSPREGTIDAPIARHPKNRKQMAVVEGGRDSVTHYTTEIFYRCPGAITPLASKVICDLDTGRTHQIRVHLLHMKCPIIGDPTYGVSTQTRLNRLKSSGLTLPDQIIDALNLVHRQALHATGLVLNHPKTNEFMSFECPLPADLATLETALLTLTN